MKVEAPAVVEGSGEGVAWVGGWVEEKVEEEKEVV